MSYTVKQIADFLQLSKPTIRKHIKRLSDEDRSGNYTDEDGTLHISEDCYRKLLELLGVETEEAETPEAIPERARNYYGNMKKLFPEKFPEKLPEAVQKQIETLENTAEDLRKQVEQLYKQLEIKDEQINTLSMLLSQQQALQLRQLEAKQEEPTPEREQKQGFFSKLFRKA